MNKLEKFQLRYAIIFLIELVLFLFFAVYSIWWSWRVGLTGIILSVAVFLITRLVAQGEFNRRKKEFEDDLVNQMFDSLFKNEDTK